MEGIGVTPGLRFYPIEEELVSFYLRHKLDGTRPDIDQVIRLVDIYTIEPWDLPNYSGELCKGDREQWFFFTGLQEREAQGGRPNRTTPSGYWKTTGSPSYVFSSDNRVIGVKKTMVFYSGKAPTGRKTKWKMNEYRAIDYHPFDTAITTTAKLRHEFSLCRVYVVSGSCRAFDRRPLDHPTTPASYSNHIIDNNNNNGDNWQVFINEGFFLDQILAEWEQQHHHFS